MAKGGEGGGGGGGGWGLVWPVLASVAHFSSGHDGLNTTVSAFIYSIYSLLPM